MRAGWTRPASWTDPDAADARARAAVALVCFCVGIALGRHGAGAPLGIWFGLALSAGALAWVTRGVACKASLCLALLLLGAGWTQARVHSVPRDSLERVLPEVVHGYADRVLTTIEGRVVSSTVRYAPAPTRLDPAWGSEAASWFDVRVTRVLADDGEIRAEGVVRVFAPGLTDADAPPGGRVRLTGWLRGAAAPDNPGPRDWRAMARQDGDVGSLTIESPESIVHLEGETALGSAVGAPTRFRGWVRRRALAALGEGDGSPARALMSALLLGEQEAAFDPVRERFQRLGAAHLLAVSGFHLAVLAGLTVTLVRLSGERGRWEALVVGALVTLYLVVLPARIPIVRAGLMVLGVLASESTGRRPDRLAVLAWVAIALLVWRPLDLWSLGFQLSFGVTGLLLWLGMTRHPWVWGTPIASVRPEAPTLRARTSRAIRATLVVCLLCWMVSAPTILVQTGNLSPIGPLASAALLPLAMLDLAVGYVCVAAGAVVPPTRAVTGEVIGALGSVTHWASVGLDAVPFRSFVLARVGGLWAIAATAWALWVIAGARVRSARLLVGGLVVVLWLGAEVALRPGPRAGVLVRIDTVSVGNGTCQIIRSGSDALLWDGGSLQRRSAERDIADACRELGVWRAPTAIVTHPNLDHYNAMPALVRPLGVRRVYVSDAMIERFDGGRAEGFWRDELERAGVRVERIGAGARIAIGDATLEIISGGGADTLGLSMNDRSLVGRVSVSTSAGERRILLTGDIGPEGMGVLRAREPGLRADVLELPHHGSVSPEALAFVQSVNPSVVLQSTGELRALDSRWEPVKEGRVWWITARHGLSWAEIRRDGSIRTGATRRAN